MVFFGREKKRKILDERMKLREERRKRLEEIVRSTETGLPAPKKTLGRSVTYEKFISEIKHKPKSFYEKVCAFAEKLPSISLGEKTEMLLKEDILASYLNVTARGVTNFAFAVFLLAFVFSALVISFLGDIFFGMFLFIFGGILAYNILNYPGRRAETLVVRMSSDTILAILYMVIYMRTSPNLEGAIKFAADNLDGELSWDLKKLLWDMEVGVYPNADVAIAKYSVKWKDKNPEFAEALNLLRNSAVGYSRREKHFDEIIKVVLDGTKDRTKKYVSDLRMPVMVIHAMGVLLPVMGLILFPIVLIFMSNTVKPIFLFIGYDVILPIFLLYVINRILSRKPPTFSQPDISLVKNIPKMGETIIMGRRIPVIIPAVSTFILMILLGFLISPSILSKPTESEMMRFSVMFILALSGFIISYCYLDSKDKIKTRDEIERIEDEFSVALFQLGNQISSGKPIERAMDGAAENMRGMKISAMFYDASANMKKFGLTFYQSLFDGKVGAVWRYPSKLVRSIMKIISDASRKGMKACSDAMVTISRYLKGVHNVKGDVREALGETTSSMNFLATFLAPMIAGLTVTMAIIILQILVRLGEQISTLVVEGAGSGMSPVQFGFLFGAGLNGGTLPIGPVEFQFIVGLYMIETVVILSFFINRIEYGEDAIGLRQTIYKTLAVASIVYLISWYFTGLIFGDPITKLLTPAV